MKSQRSSFLNANNNMSLYIKKFPSPERNITLNFCRYTAHSKHFQTNCVRIDIAGSRCFLVYILDIWGKNGLFCEVCVGMHYIYQKKNSNICSFRILYLSFIIAPVVYWFIMSKIFYWYIQWSSNFKDFFLNP